MAGSQRKGVVQLPEKWEKDGGEVLLLLFLLSSESLFLTYPGLYKSSYKIILLEVNTPALRLRLKFCLKICCFLSTAFKTHPSST